MTRVSAVAEAIESLADAEARFGLRLSDRSDFFTEWQQATPSLSEAEQAATQTMARRLTYHRAQGELLEGIVTLLVAAPLLEVAGFYDPPFTLQAEAAVEISVEDKEETLRGRIDVLVLQGQLWVLVLESKKTTISLRHALPQALAYMMGMPQQAQPLFGMFTNGDDVLFVKLTAQPSAQYGLSRSFSLYTLPSELEAAVRILKGLGQKIA